MRTLARNGAFRRRAPLIVRLAQIPVLIPGTTQTYQPTVENAIGAVTWSLAIDAPGLTIHPTTGLLTWVTGDGQPSSFRIRAVDSAGGVGEFETRSVNFFAVQEGTMVYYDVNTPGTVFSDLEGTQPAVVGGVVRCILAVSGQHAYRLVYTQGELAYLQVDGSGRRYINFITPNGGGQAPLFMAATAIPVNAVPNNNRYTLSTALVVSYLAGNSAPSSEPRRVLTFSDTAAGFQGPYMVAQHDYDVYVHMPYRPEKSDTHRVSRRSGSLNYSTNHGSGTALGTSSLAVHAAEGISAISARCIVNRSSSGDRPSAVTYVYDGRPVEDLNSHYAHGVEGYTDFNYVRFGQASTRLCIGGYTATATLDTLAFRFYRAAVHMVPLESNVFSTNADIDLFNLCTTGMNLPPITAAGWTQPGEVVIDSPGSLSSSAPSNTGQPNRYNFGDVVIRHMIRGPKTFLRDTNSGRGSVSFTSNDWWSQAAVGYVDERFNRGDGKISVTVSITSLQLTTGVLGSQCYVDMNFRVNYDAYPQGTGLVNPFPNQILINVPVSWNS